MGTGNEGDGKYGSKGAGSRSDVQVVGTVGYIIWQRELGGDSGNAQGPVGVPPPGGVTDHGVGREMCIRQIVGVPPDSVGNGRSKAPLHRGVHQDTAYNHSIKGGLPPHI